MNKKGVDQWRSLVGAELDRSRYPLPPELVLAVMKRESNGKTGVVNTSSGASGLMQCMPIALADYNQNHKLKYTMSDLRSKTGSGARIQVRVGLWILARFWRGAYNYLKKRLGNVALDDLAKTADFFYAAGPGNARKRLDQVKRPTFEAVKARFPKWDRIVPAQRVWDWVEDHGGQWKLDAIDQWLEGGVLAEKKNTILGAALGLVLIAVAWWYFSQRSKK